MLSMPKYAARKQYTCLPAEKLNGLLLCCCYKDNNLWHSAIEKIRRKFTHNGYVWYAKPYYSIDCIQTSYVCLQWYS